MSKLTPNVLDTARLYRGVPLTCRTSHGFSAITLTSACLAFEVSKNQPRARFFSDKSMMRTSGGPWFIEVFKTRLAESAQRLSNTLLDIEIQDITAGDLFGYRSCGIHLSTRGARSTPIALQIVQKGQLLALADEIMDWQISEL